MERVNWDDLTNVVCCLKEQVSCLGKCIEMKATLGDILGLYTLRRPKSPIQESLKKADFQVWQSCVNAT